MAKRGPKSKADLEAGNVIVGSFGKRPDPPDELNPRQQEIWRETVASEASDFFSTAALRSLLANYCRHTEAAEGISSVINEFKPEWLKNSDGSKRYHLLIKMREIEVRASLSCATKLRLTNQSRYTPQAASTAARNAPKAKPWEM